jgi:hypothetical protein
MTLGTSGNGEANPYAAPRSRVADAAVGADEEPAFFPVSLLKLTLMSVATFSLYQIYWFYRNWKCVHRLNDEKANAPIRAFFYPVTSYFLFRRIRENAQKVDGGAALQAGLLAIGVFVFSALWRLPDPYWFVSLLGFLPLLPVQSLANRINRKVAPHADSNSRFGGWNIAGMVAGGLLLALAIIGMFIEE